MAIEAHIAELAHRHKRLEDELHEELQHPAADPIRIANLKRQKLRLKDEIERLRLITYH